MIKYKKPLNPYRNITCTAYGYMVRKTINGEVIYGGTYKTLKEAQKERDFLDSIDWNYSNMN